MQNPQFLFYQGAKCPVVGWESIPAGHHQRPDYLIAAKAKMDEAERIWLAQTDIEPPAYEALRLSFEAFQQAEAAYRTAWQRWNEEKAALLAALN